MAWSCSPRSLSRRTERLPTPTSRGSMALVGQIMVGGYGGVYGAADLGAEVIRQPHGVAVLVLDGLLHDFYGYVGLVAGFIFAATAEKVVVDAAVSALAAVWTEGGLPVVGVVCDICCDGYRAILHQALTAAGRGLVSKSAFLQLPPHHIQTLPHNEVEAKIHRALRPSTPQPPCPPRPPAVLALAPFVDTVLPEQHDRAGKQPHSLLFECG